MIAIINTHKTTILIVLAVMAIVFIYADPLVVRRSTALGIISDYNASVKLDTGYVKSRAKAIKGKKDTFEYLGATYITATGKKK